MGELWISVVITFLFVIIHTACGQMHLKIISTDHKTGKEMTSYYTIDDKALGFELAQDAGGSTQIKVPGTLEIPDEFISAWISDIMPNNIIPKDEHYTNQIESINTHFKCTVQQTRLDAKVESVSVHVTLTNEQDTILNVDVSNLSKGIDCLMLLPNHEKLKYQDKFVLFREGNPEGELLVLTQVIQPEMYTILSVKKPNLEALKIGDLILSKRAPYDMMIRILQKPERTSDDLEMIYEELNHIKAFSHLNEGFKRGLAAVIQLQVIDPPVIEPEVTTCQVIAPQLNKPQLNKPQVIGARVTEGRKKGGITLFNCGDIANDWYIILQGAVDLEEVQPLEIPPKSLATESSSLSKSGVDIRGSSTLQFTEKQDESSSSDISPRNKRFSSLFSKRPLSISANGVLPTKKLDSKSSSLSQSATDLHSTQQSEQPHLNNRRSTTVINKYQNLSWYSGILGKEKKTVSQPALETTSSSPTPAENSNTNGSTSSQNQYTGENQKSKYDEPSSASEITSNGPLSESLNTQPSLDYSISSDNKLASSSSGGDGKNSKQQDELNGPGNTKKKHKESSKSLFNLLKLSSGSKTSNENILNSDRNEIPMISLLHVGDDFGESDIAEERDIIRSARIKIYERCQLLKVSKPDYLALRAANADKTNDSDLLFRKYRSGNLQDPYPKFRYILKSAERVHILSYILNTRFSFGMKDKRVNIAENRKYAGEDDDWLLDDFITTYVAYIPTQMLMNELRRQHRIISSCEDKAYVVQATQKVVRFMRHCIRRLGANIFDDIGTIPFLTELFRVIDPTDLLTTGSSSSRIQKNYQVTIYPIRNSKATLKQPDKTNEPENKFGDEINNIIRKIRTDLSDYMAERKKAENEYWDFTQSFEPVLIYREGNGKPILQPYRNMRRTDIVKFGIHTQGHDYVQLDGLPLSTTGAELKTVVAAKLKTNAEDITLMIVTYTKSERYIIKDTDINIITCLPTTYSRIYAVPQNMATMERGNDIVSGLQDMIIIGISAEAIAYFLTIFDLTLFSHMFEHSVIGFDKFSKFKPELNLIIQHCNNLGALVSTSICQTTDLKKRRKLIRKYLNLAKYLLLYKNLHAFSGICGGLEYSSVARLKETWDGISEDDMQPLLEYRNSLAQPDKNRKMYRRFIQGYQPPYLLNMAVHLPDILFSEEGNAANGERQNFDGLILRANTMRLVKRGVKLGFGKTLNDTIALLKPPSVSNSQLKKAKEFVSTCFQKFRFTDSDKLLDELSLKIQPRKPTVKSIENAFEGQTSNS